MIFTKHKKFTSTCCFTGHRPQSLPFGYDEKKESCVHLKELLRQEIERQITDNGVTHFITGMALGIDLIAGELVIELKQKYPKVTLESAIPCETQATKWSDRQRERYYNLAAQCDKETMLQTAYTKDCFQKRSVHGGSQ